MSVRTTFAPGLLALALPWYSAREHRARMQQAAHVSGFIVLSRDRETGRVRLDREGRAVIDYSVGTMERALLQRGISTAARIHRAAGAVEIQTLHTTDLSYDVRAIHLDARAIFSKIVTTPATSSTRCVAAVIPSPTLMPTSPSLSTWNTVSSVVSSPMYRMGLAPASSRMASPLVRLAVVSSMTSFPSMTSTSGWLSSQALIFFNAAASEPSSTLR